MSPTREQNANLQADADKLIGVIQCELCRNSNNNGTCKAFPEQIPMEILTGAYNHVNLFPGQENDILFDPIDEDERDKDSKTTDPKYKDPEEQTLDSVNTMPGNIDFSCFGCVHLRKDGYTCNAFPDQIPDSIRRGQRRHTKKMFGQKNDLVFARKD